MQYLLQLSSTRLLCDAPHTLSDLGCKESSSLKLSRYSFMEHFRLKGIFYIYYRAYFPKLSVYGGFAGTILGCQRGMALPDSTYLTPIQNVSTLLCNAGSQQTWDHVCLCVYEVNLDKHKSMKWQYMTFPMKASFSIYRETFKTCLFLCVLMNWIAWLPNISQGINDTTYRVEYYEESCGNAFSAVVLCMVISIWWDKKGTE